MSHIQILFFEMKLLGRIQIKTTNLILLTSGTNFNVVNSKFQMLVKIYG